MEFVCPRCNYSTSHKHHFINHINRKKDCPSTISEVCLESLREQYTKPISIYTCEHCSKSFKHQPNMSRHKKTCKRSTTSEKKHSEDHIERLTEMLKIMQDDITNIKNMNALIREGPSCTNITTNNQITINITNFGCENTKHLDESFLTQCFMEKNIFDIIEKIHFDKEYPQNKNVRIKSLKYSMMETYDDGKWVIMDKGETYNRLVDKGATILKFHVKRNKERIQNECNEDEEDFDDLKEYIDFVQEDNELKAPVLQKLDVLFVNDPEISLKQEEFE